MEEFTKEEIDIMVRALKLYGNNIFGPMGSDNPDVHLIIGHGKDPQTELSTTIQLRRKLKAKL